MYNLPTYLTATGLLLSTAILSPVWADDEAGVFFGYYQDDNNLSVITPKVHVSKDITERDTVKFRYTFEKFDKEAPAAATDGVDAVTGATTVSGGTGGGFQETRHDLSLTGSHQFQTSTLSGGVYYSDENDYASAGFSLGYGRDMVNRNFNLTAVVGVNNDEVDSLDPNPDPEGPFPRYKDVATFTMTATQLLDPKTFFSGGYTLAQIDGYQSLPLRAIQTLEGEGEIKVTRTFAESHPEERDRNVFFARVKRFFINRSAIDANVSIYTDTWGVDANSVDLRYYDYLNEKVYARLRYMYYSQSEADFYQAVYTEPQQIMTADPRLRRFDAHLLGAKVTMDLSEFGFYAWNLGLAFDFYRQTHDGIQSRILKVILKAPF